ncbi:MULTISPECIES: thiamine phosphate synthase [Kocuria]|uniref:Thiamine-phosphate synthase n=2 Tax=Kocuria TaxID=57493 RepID=A0A7D7KXS5_KOCVA|nr:MULTISPECIES: thiamine phosphate synthase [Kocuria]MDN5631298.1 thiamine phosphate synthase [Kocuria sp.]QMS55566.1 Thiamine-phosphate synthase [Kocuria varians]RUP84414.1 thiamine phosphate synthase [Kocuria sp. HSID17590]
MGHTNEPGTRRRAALQDARLYVCVTARRERGDLREFLHAAYEGGVDIIQLRDKSLEAAAEIQAIEVLAEVAREHGKLFAVNDRADVALLTGADVFHVGQGDLSTEQARTVLGPDVVLGRSCHSTAQVDAALADPGLDYFCTGPVWETPTKPGRAAVGLELPRYAAEHAGATPFYAIGGIDAARLPEVLGTGASRIVVVRAVTEADDVAAAARALRTALPA